MNPRTIVESAAEAKAAENRWTKGDYERPQLPATIPVSPQITLDIIR